jgi:hypothetical protein
VIKIVPFLALALLCGCTVVSADRVFPKFTWYWTKDAQRQRESDAMSRDYSRTNRPATWER